MTPLWWVDIETEHSTDAPKVISHRYIVQAPTREQAEEDARRFYQERDPQSLLPIAAVHITPWEHGNVLPWAHSVEPRLLQQ